MQSSITIIVNFGLLVIQNEREKFSWFSEVHIMNTEWLGLQVVNDTSQRRKVKLSGGW